MWVTEIARDMTARCPQMDVYDPIHRAVPAQMRSLNNNSFMLINNSLTLIIGPAGYECYDRPATSSGASSTSSAHSASSTLQAQAIRSGPARPLAAPKSAHVARKALPPLASWLSTADRRLAWVIAGW